MARTHSWPQPSTQGINGASAVAGQLDEVSLDLDCLGGRLSDHGLSEGGGWAAWPLDWPDGELSNSHWSLPDLPPPEDIARVINRYGGASIFDEEAVPDSTGAPALGASSHEDTRQ